jgi:hypothetical protein
MLYADWILLVLLSFTLLGCGVHTALRRRGVEDPNST